MGFGHHLRHGALHRMVLVSGTLNRFFYFYPVFFSPFCGSLQVAARCIDRPVPSIAVYARAKSETKIKEKRRWEDFRGKRTLKTGCPESDRCATIPSWSQRNRRSKLRPTPVGGGGGAGGWGLPLLRRRPKPRAPLIETKMQSINSTISCFSS